MVPFFESILFFFCIAGNTDLRSEGTWQMNSFSPHWLQDSSSGGENFHSFVSPQSMFSLTSIHPFSSDSLSHTSLLLWRIGGHVDASEERTTTAGKCAIIVSSYVVLLSSYSFILECRWHVRSLVKFRCFCLAYAIEPCWCSVHSIDRLTPSRTYSVGSSPTRFKRSTLTELLNGGVSLAQCSSDCGYVVVYPSDCKDKRKNNR